MLQILGHCLMEAIPLVSPLQKGSTSPYTNLLEFADLFPSLERAARHDPGFRSTV